MARKTPTLATLKRNLKMIIESDSAEPYINQHSPKHTSKKLSLAIAAGKKAEVRLKKYGLFDKDGRTKWNIRNKTLYAAAEWFNNQI